MELEEGGVRQTCAKAAIFALGAFEDNAGGKPGASWGERMGRLLAAVGWACDGDEWEEARAQCRREWQLDSDPVRDGLLERLKRRAGFDAPGPG